EVRTRGDAARSEWALRLDGAEPARAEPAEGLPDEAVLALADAVRRWHAVQRPRDVRLEVAPGVELERRWVPLRSVGVYVPRGLVSTLVMCVVPAQVAGVERIVVTTPPAGAGLVAAAARLLGISEVWALGGPPARRPGRRFGGRADRGGGAGTRAPRPPGCRCGSARPARPQRRRDLRRPLVGRRRRRLRDRRQPCPSHRRLGSGGRRPRAGDVPQAGDRPAAGEWRAGAAPAGRRGSG